MLYLETYILFLDGMQERHFIRYILIHFPVKSYSNCDIIDSFFQFVTPFYDVSPLYSKVDGAPFWQNFILYAQNTAYPRKTSSLNDVPSIYIKCSPIKKNTEGLGTLVNLCTNVSCLNH